MSFTLFPGGTTGSKALFSQRNSEIPTREEIRRFLYGDARESGHGTWMVFRRFDTNTINKPYNRFTEQGTVYLPTGEAINDFLYAYTDTPVRVGQKELTVSASRFRIESRAPTGISTLVYKEFYLEFDINPTENDILYQINYVGEEAPDVEPPYDRGWDIQHVQDFRGAQGKIEFWGVICRRRQSR